MFEDTELTQELTELKTLGISEAPSSASGLSTQDLREMEGKSQKN